jgi:hypothetical protein
MGFFSMIYEQRRYAHPSNLSTKNPPKSEYLYLLKERLSRTPASADNFTRTFKASLRVEGTLRLQLRVIS